MCSRGHPDLWRLLTRRAGLRSDVERFAVETQVGAPGQRRLVDLVVRGSAPGGEVVSSLFVECKYNPQRNRNPTGSRRTKPTDRRGLCGQSRASDG